jgi:hypothetical protein
MGFPLWLDVRLAAEAAAASDPSYQDQRFAWPCPAALESPVLASSEALTQPLGKECVAVPVELQILIRG